MAAELLLPTARAADSDGNPYSGAEWTFYATGTLTQQSVYADAALSTSLGSTVTADSGGKFVPIYFDASLSYRGICKDASGAVTLHDIDPINASAFASLAGANGSASIGFKQSGTGAVARTAQAKLRERVSVVDFLPAGYVTDGSVDYSTHFQAAIDAYSPGGAIVHVPAGTFKANIVLKRGITLKGAGQRETIINPATNDHTIKTPLTVPTVRIGIEDMQVNGNPAYTGKDAVHLEASGLGNFVDTIYLKNTYFSNAGRAGLYMKGTDTSGPFVQRLFMDNALCEFNQTHNMLVIGAVLECRATDCGFGNTLATDGTGHCIRFEDDGAGSFTAQFLFINCLSGNPGAYNLGNAAPGCSIRAGSSIKFVNCNFEAVRPAVQLEDFVLSEGVTWSGGKIAVTQDVDTLFDVQRAVGRFTVEDLRVDVQAGKTLTSVAKISNGMVNVPRLRMESIVLNGAVTNLLADAANWYQVIASGTAVYYRPFMTLWGEGALADDLVNITDVGGSTTRFKAGDTVTISVFDGQPAVTVKNTGNMALANGKDCVLANGSCTLTLRWSRNLTKWVEVSRTVATTAIAAPTGGSVIDVEARAAIDLLRAALQAQGVTA